MEVDLLHPYVDDDNLHTVFGSKLILYYQLKAATRVINEDGGDAAVIELNSFSISLVFFSFHETCNWGSASLRKLRHVVHVLVVSR